MRHGASFEVTEIPGEDSDFPRHERFEVVGRAGVGSSARVFRAYDRTLGCEVALKSLRSLNAEEQYRLKHEFRVLAKLAHPNLVALHELFTTAASPFFTMEYLDGSDLLGFVRETHAPGRLLDADAIERLRLAFTQLAEGVAALHQAGRLHRDIKPSNVQITERQRCVLVDFGLADWLAPGPPDPGQATMIGTLAYMAPEAAWGDAASEAVDWYSVGALLYEVMMGRPPWEGHPAEVLEQKSQPGFIDAIRFDSELPPDLCDLTRKLIDPRAEQRPSPVEILRAVSDGRHEGAVWIAPPRTGFGPAPFVGRESELKWLGDAWSRTASGELCVARVEGPSGIGKSELVDRFIATVEEDDNVSVLRGRCCPRESVPFNALDGFVDDLSRALVSSRHDGFELPEPADVRALLELFPVLERASRLLGWTVRPTALDRVEVRRRGVGALRELLGHWAKKKKLIIWLDDLHWADRDSAELINGLVRGPDAPALLLMLSYRADEPEVLAAFEGVGGDHAIRLALSPLGDLSTAQLVGALVADAPAEMASQVVEQSDGSPFLVCEIARYLAASASSGLEPERKSVSEVIRWRIDQLPAPGKALLESVAVAGFPVTREHAFGVSGLGWTGRIVAFALQDQGLLRARVEGALDRFEISHHQIREAVVAGIDPRARQTLHKRFAKALTDDPRADPGQIAEHHLLGGDPDRAATFALQAAARAERELGFNRAAELYRFALRLRGDLDSDWPIRAQLAESLAKAGAGAASAKEFAAAAESASGSASSRAADDEDPVADLRRNAAEQWLRVGDVRRGIAALRSVLRGLGLPYPRTSATAIGRVLAIRAWVGVRGLDVATRVASRRDLQRVDACFTAGLGLNMVDILRSAAFQSLHVQLALRAGEPGRAIRALTAELTYLANDGGAANRQRSAEIRHDIESRLVELDDPGAYAFFELCGGVASVFSGRWTEAIEQLVRAERQYLERHDGVIWETAMATMYRIWAETYLGRFDRLGTVVPRLLEDARARGDVIAAASLGSGLSNLVWLAGDDVPAARLHASQAVSPFPNEPFQSPHYFDLVAQCNADLYSGDGVTAWYRLRVAWPRLRSVLFFRMQFFRIELHYLRARTALAAVCAIDSGEDHRQLPSRRRLLAVADRDAERLFGEDIAFSKALGAIIYAELRWLRGDRAGGEVSASLAEDGLRSCGLAYHAAAVGYRLRGDRSALLSLGIAEPSRMARVLVASRSLQADH